MQQPNTRKFREELTRAVGAAEKRVAAAQTGLERANEELATAQQEFQQAQTQLEGFLQLFPVDATAVATAASEEPQSNPARAGGRRMRGELTVSERLVTVIGTGTLSTADIRATLIERGLAPKNSNPDNLRGYISTVLSTTSRPIQNQDGSSRKVKVFQSVKHGFYRINPEVLGDFQYLLGDAPVAAASAPAAQVAEKPVAGEPVMATLVSAEDLLNEQGLNAEDFANL